MKGMSDHVILSEIIPIPPLQMVFFGGKGGVGKTTCAVSAGVSLAHDHPDLSIMIVSTDPAHSVKDSLGHTNLPPNLSCSEFDAQSHLEAFKEKNRGTLREIARRGTFLDDGDIRQFIDLSLPGMDELMAFLEIAKWVEDRQYDLIIIDTAPTGHTLRLLEMPELSKAWLEALDTLLGKHRYMKKVFSGRYEPDDIDRFILSLSERIDGFESLLTDSNRCAFVPVLIAEPLSLSETGLLLEKLTHLKIPVNHLVVNRLYPETGCDICTTQHIRQLDQLKRHAKILSGHQLWGIPLFESEVGAGKLLDTFFSCAKKLNLDPKRTGRRLSVTSGYTVSSPMALPDLEKRLLFFAGKGGVGKTSLACATGVHLSRVFSGKKIFIFSTDPAHSLSDCFDIPIKDKPVKIRQNLMAAEMDGTKEFEDLKTLYQEEVKAFLSRISSNLDLTFDREVMERVMDLSPTGVDEIMAINSALTFMGKKPDDIFILDTAPTGHLIRLLEMPEVMDQWIKVFFNLFIKYRNIFQAGDLTEKLVHMSKELKAFVKMLHHPQKSGIYLVSILTRMAFEEANDLSSACKRLNIQLDGLWLNLATQDQDCPLCHAVYRRESKIKTLYENKYKTIPTGLVFKAEHPVGLANLEKLGGALFSAKP